MADDDKFVRMVHPQIEGEAWVTRDAFRDCYAEKGWVLEDAPIPEPVSDDPFVHAPDKFDSAIFTDPTPEDGPEVTVTEGR